MNWKLIIWYISINKEWFIKVIDKKLKFGNYNI